MDNEISIDYASKTTRFLNLVIDTIAFWILFVIHVFVFEDALKATKGLALFNFIYCMVFYCCYNLIFELVFGKTIGKFLTGTKVVDQTFTKPSFKQLLLRNVCRLIPFDTISFLFAAGWHDSISKTTVINK